jgi:hypothetical protein
MTVLFSTISQLTTVTYTWCVLLQTWTEITRFFMSLKLPLLFWVDTPTVAVNLLIFTNTEMAVISRKAVTYKPRQFSSCAPGRHLWCWGSPPCTWSTSRHPLLWAWNSGHSPSRFHEFLPAKKLAWKLLCYRKWRHVAFGKNFPKFSVRGIWGKRIFVAQRYTIRWNLAHGNEADVNIWLMDKKTGKIYKTRDINYVRRSHKYECKKSANCRQKMNTDLRK